MDKEFPERIYQDENFIVNGFSGKKLEQLIGFEWVKNPGNPIIVYLKAEGNDLQRFFLDAGIGFWETASTMEDENEEGFIGIDYAQKFNIRDAKISKIYCEKKQNSSQMVLVMDNNQQLILRYKNAKIVDSECEFIKVEEH